VRHLQEVREVEHLPGILIHQLDRDGETSQVKRALRSWHKWFTPVILATQEAEIRRIMGSKPAPAKSFMRPYLKKPFTKMGSVEWLKVKALSSSPSTAKQKQKQKTKALRKVKLI
jgi:hypothetical protein